MNEQEIERFCDEMKASLVAQHRAGRPVAVRVRADNEDVLDMHSEMVVDAVCMGWVYRIAVGRPAEPEHRRLRGPLRRNSA